jgi:hypothetical protein
MILPYSGINLGPKKALFYNAATSDGSGRAQLHRVKSPASLCPSCSSRSIIMSVSKEEITGDGAQGKESANPYGPPHPDAYLDGGGILLDIGSKDTDDSVASTLKLARDGRVSRMIHREETVMKSTAHCSRSLDGSDSPAI